MSLLRTVGRTMLASFFVVNGARTVRDPHDLVPVTQPIADTVVPLVKKAAPSQVAELIPTDTVTLVRINGGLQVAGGLALATGKFRRVGAVLLAGSIIPQTLARHAFWTAEDPETKADQREQFIKNLALMGSVLLAALDTEGKPSLAWRAQAGTERSAKKVKRGAERSAKRIRREAEQAAEHAQLRARLAAKEAKNRAGSVAKDAEIAVKDVRLGLS